MPRVFLNLISSFFKLTTSFSTLELLFGTVFFLTPNIFLLDYYAYGELRGDGDLFIYRGEPLGLFCKKSSEPKDALLAISSSLGVAKSILTSLPAPNS